MKTCVRNISYIQPQRRAFTLVEIIVVIMIIGLLTGLAVIKLADSRDRAATNYLKSAARQLDDGIQRIIAVEGTFPTITSTTPEDRVAEIAGILSNKGIYVDNLHQLKIYLANSAFSANLLKANQDARDGRPTGQPLTKELLVLPREGPIVYPDVPQIALNDPTSPNYTYYYTDYWLPKEITSAVANLLRTGDLTEKERALLVNNLGQVPLSPELLKGLALGATNSEEYKNALASLIDSFKAGTSPLNEDQLIELVQQMLHEGYYDGSVSLSGLDFTKFDPVSLTKLAQNKFLSPAEYEQLAHTFKDANNVMALGTLLGNTGVDLGTTNAILDLIRNASAESYFGYSSGMPISSALMSAMSSPTMSPDKFASMSSLLFAKLNDPADPLPDYLKQNGLATISSGLYAQLLAGKDINDYASTLNSIITASATTPNYALSSLAASVQFPIASLDLMRNTYLSNPLPGQFLSALVKQGQYMDAEDKAPLIAYWTSSWDIAKANAGYQVFSSAAFFPTTAELQPLLDTTLTNYNDPAAATLLYSIFGTPERKPSASQVSQLLGAINSDPGASTMQQVVALIPNFDLTPSQKTNLTDLLISRAGDYQYTGPLASLDFGSENNARLLAYAAANPGSQLTYNLANDMPVVTQAAVDLYGSMLLADPGSFAANTFFNKMASGENPKATVEAQTAVANFMATVPAAILNNYMDAIVNINTTPSPLSTALSDAYISTLDSNHTYTAKDYKALALASGNAKDTVLNQIVDSNFSNQYTANLPANAREFLGDDVYGALLDRMLEPNPPSVPAQVFSAATASNDQITKMLAVANNSSPEVKTAVLSNLVATMKVTNPISTDILAQALANPTTSMASVASYFMQVETSNVSDIKPLVVQAKTTAQSIGADNTKAAALLATFASAGGNISKSAPIVTAAFVEMSKNPALQSSLASYSWLLYYTRDSLSLDEKRSLTAAGYGMYLTL